nr:unnamed protein product [Digitaria exilis]
MTAGFQLGVIGSLALSVASSVAIVICNKALISTLGFPFGKHPSSAVHNYNTDKLASDGDLLETIKFSLLVLLLGVGIASVTDLKLNFLGSVLSGLAIATTCVGQILTNTIQRKLKVSSTQLLYQSAPYQAAILFATGPFVDHLLTNRSVFAHKYTFPVVGFIVLSCLIAVSVNFSTFLVIGTTSPVTYQVLGHLKTCLVLSFGYTLLHDPFTARNILGILVAIFGMALYSYFSVREGKKKSAGDALPVSQMPDKETEPLLVSTKDGSDTKKANGVAHDC